MTYEPPRPQQRYMDTGRREITLAGRTVLASRLRLKEGEAALLKATHEIFIERQPGLTNQQLVGQEITFDGDVFRVVKVTDPKSTDPVMRGKYLRLISVQQPPG